MRKKTSRRFAPSMRAASSRLTGMPLKNCVNRNMASPFEMLGKMSAQRVFTSPIFVIMV